MPTQTRRSEESQNFQQFSTPIPLGLAALTAAAITPDDRVLEPSAGTGLLAILAQTIGGSLTGRSQEIPVFVLADLEAIGVRYDDRFSRALTTYIAARLRAF